MYLFTILWIYPFATPIGMRSAQASRLRRAQSIYSDSDFHSHSDDRPGQILSDGAPHALRRNRSPSGTSALKNKAGGRAMGKQAPFSVGQPPFGGSNSATTAHHNTFCPD